MKDSPYTKYASYEVWQDGMCVAKTSGPEHDARRDAMHYAMMYGQDGPVKVYVVHKGKRAEVTP
jgi:hypothetical protein